ncbi:MAG TPA: hypothetical protein VLV83_22940 [Acidobacteriota bacterium]|nr:hypothetical protein [Acidobacteriota bacterium]
MRLPFLLTCLTLAGPWNVFAQDVRLQLNPVQTGVELDGTLEPEEWQPAQSVTLQHGTRLLIQQSGSRLFIGIKAQDGFSIGNIFIRRGDQIWNLHASAAMGTIRFAASGDGWQVEEQSGWSGRGANLAEVESDFEASFQQYGWAGTNARLGASGEREFALKLDHFLPRGEGELRLVITHIHLDPERIESWPQPDDSTIDPQVLKGYFPEQLSFNESGWGVLVLGDR